MAKLSRSTVVDVKPEFGEACLVQGRKLTHSGATLTVLVAHSTADLCRDHLMVDDVARIQPLLCADPEAVAAELLR